MASTFEPSSGYKRSEGKHHLALDLSYWEQLHKNSTNLDRSVDAWFYHPLDFITYSKLREELVPQVQHNGIPIPTDLVFWMVDEPFRPYLTRTGAAIRPVPISFQVNPRCT